MHVRIVGAGIAGLSAAWAFHRAGCDVAIVDRAAIPNPGSGSYDHSRLIHPFPADTGAPARLRRSAAAWDLVWGDLGKRLLRDCGVVSVLTDRRRAPAMIDHLHHAGVEATRLHGPALTARLPGIELAASAAAIDHPGGGVLLAREILDSLASHLAAQRVSITPFECVAPDDIRHTDADVTVLACGPRNRTMAASLPPDLADGLIPVRQVMLYLRPPPMAAPRWTGSAAFVGLGDEDELWGVPPIDDLPLKLAVGAFARPGDSADPPTRDEVVRILDRFAPLIRDLDRYAVVDARACGYTRSDADDWMVTRIAGSGRPVWLFGGCNGSGFKSAPRAALDLVDRVLENCAAAGANPTTTR